MPLSPRKSAVRKANLLASSAAGAGFRWSPWWATTDSFRVLPSFSDTVTRAAFGQRRKMLRRALRGLTADPQALLQGAGIPPEARAETLSVAEFCALARAWSLTGQAEGR